jgi:hypothetical protein
MNAYKNSILRTLLHLCLAGSMLANTCLAADIYKTVDENGNVVFSDQPAKEAEKVEVQAPITFDSSALTRPNETGNKNNPEADPANFKYSRLEITSPANDTAIRDNAGNFELSYVVEPRALPQHSVQLMMDGKVHTRVSQSGTIEFQNVDRGTHVFQLRVVRKSNKKVLEKGPASSVSILRHSSSPKPVHLPSRR